MMTPEQACEAAVRQAGGPAAVGAVLGISGQAVSQWKAVPPKRLRRLLEIEGVSVSASECCPDIYPPGFEFPPERASTSEAGYA